MILIALSLPVCIWEGVVYILESKSLSNLIIEPLVLAAAVLVLTLAFAALARFANLNGRVLKACFILATMLCAVSVLALTPDLGE